MTFNLTSHHKQVVSPASEKTKRCVIPIKLPNRFKGIDDKCDKMIEVTSRMEFYFPDVQSNTDSWTNLHAVLCHATHAYTFLRNESEQLKGADLKISVLEEQIETLENDFMKEKTKQKINALLKILNLEVEEELKESIYDLIWFVQPGSGDKNYISLYNPKVGPNDYKNFLGKFVSITFLIDHASFLKSSKMH